MSTAPRRESRGRTKDCPPPRVSRTGASGPDDDREPVVTVMPAQES
jgi:hypothetical protein